MIVGAHNDSVLKRRRIGYRLQQLGLRQLVFGTVFVLGNRLGWERF